MAVIQRESAQVRSSVQDLSQADLRPAYAFFACITATKGPLNVGQLITSVEAGEAIFGEATGPHVGLVSAFKIIEGGIPGILVRVASSSLASAKAEIPAVVAGDPILKFFIKNQGSDGNAYSLSVSVPTGDNFTVAIKRGTLILETISVSNNEESPDYVLNLEHDILGVELMADEYSPILNGEYVMSGGNDGLEGIQASDYIGTSSGGQYTGAQIFRQKTYKGQVFPSLGYTDKEFLGALKDIADARKDLTCVYDTPPGLTRLQAENWVKNEGAYKDDEYLLSGWNCEVYWDWQKDVVKGAQVILPPSLYVTLNSLKSFAKVGPWFPVAGDSRGVINSVAVVTQLPLVSDRNSLVSNSINPIYDTGTRGIQIYGNETLNPTYTDLSSAHIARTLTYIRSTIDEFTETKKFELNDSILWADWVDYVQDKVLAPIRANRGLQWYRATMGTSTTSALEISQRKVRGRVELQFTPDAEVFVLDYVVYASSEDMTNA